MSNYPKFQAHEIKRLLAIDPGETTGYVLADVNIRPELTIIEIDAWEGFGGLLQHTKLFSDPHPKEHRAPFPDHVIIEDYRIYPHRAQQHIGSRPFTVEMIGVVRWICYLNSIPITFQSASQAKQLWTNQRVKKHFPNKRFPKPHHKDAFRHLLTYIENEGLMTFFKLEDAV